VIGFEPARHHNAGVDFLPLYFSSLLNALIGEGELIHDHRCQLRNRFAGANREGESVRNFTTANSRRTSSHRKKHLFIANRLGRIELKAATDAVNLERKQLAEVQALARIGSWRSDVRSNSVSWSDEYYRLLGMDPSEGGASFSAFFDRVHADDREAVLAAFTATGPSELDHRLLLRDGQIKWVHQRWQFLRDASEEIVSGTGTTQDITERKSAETLLRHNEQLLRIASRLGRMGGWSLNIATSSVSLSDEACAILGLVPGTYPSLSELQFCDPAHIEKVRQSLEACIADRTPFDLEIPIVNTSGSALWVRSIGEAEVDALGNVIAVRGAIQDISERVRSIDALLESDLRFRLAAEATSDVVWDWDLRSDVCWWSDGLQTKFGHAGLRETPVAFWSDNIHPDDRARVLSSVELKLATSKPWFAEYRFRKGDGSYVLVSDHAVVGGTREDGGISRMLGAMRDITEQRAGEARLDQAQRLANAGQLASNMAHSFNNVLMGIQPFVEVARRLTQDNPRAQNAIERIAGSVKRGKEITADILRLTAGGEAVAQPDDVRSWLLNLSSETASSTPEAVPASVEATPMTVDKAQLPKSVLIVDDEPSVAEGISMLLAAEGVECHSVLEGGAAISAIERFSPEAVLLDVGLSDLSGVEVFLQIRARWPALPVVVMTGHYARADLAVSLDSPHDGFLQKPFDAQELFAILVRVGARVEIEN